MSQYYVTVADDWQCGGTGLVKDIHTWVSFQGDLLFEPDAFHLAIWSDDPVNNSGIAGEDPDNTFSKPLNRLWHGDRLFGEYTIRPWATGDQGWFDPREPGDYPDEIMPIDHQGVYQVNFLFDDSEAFWQEEGTIYWLEFAVQTPHEGMTSNRLGWKESENHFMDDAVWWDDINEVWNELVDPITGISMDMAFVITPEPSSLALVLIMLASLMFVRRRV